MAARGVAPDWASVALGNALLATASSLFVVGFRRFSGVADTGLWTLVVGLSTGVVGASLSISARVVWISLVTAAACAGCLVYLARLWRLHRVTALVTATILGLGVLISLGRAAIVAKDGMVGSLLEQRGWQHLLPFVYSMLFQTWLPVAIGQFVNARLGLKLIRAREEAEAASKAKSVFLATMSHELRTPMNGVINLADLALDEPLTDTARQYLRGVHESARSLLGILNDVLDFSRLEAARVEVERIPYGLEELLRQSEVLLGPGARGRGLAFSVILEGALPRLVLGDPLRLRQVLNNLLGNAVKFTQAGAVTLRVSAQPAAPGHALIRLAVEDTGVGLSTEAQGRLFVSFSQADASTTRKFGGTGFFFSLPFQLAPELPALAPEVQPPRPTFPGLEVLLVEDNPTNQLVARRLLERQGVKVTLAATGRHALEQVQSGARFDVVLMDLQMPELDGLEATRALRALGFRPPIIAMTADVLTSREHCLAAGMNDHLSKPIDPRLLYATLVAWTKGPASPT